MATQPAPDYALVPGHNVQRLHVPAHAPNKRPCPVRRAAPGFDTIRRNGGCRCDVLSSLLQGTDHHCRSSSRHRQPDRQQHRQQHTLLLGRLPRHKVGCSFCTATGLFKD
eukprot:353077-Chlamydomonas_euryale.AAC.5